MFYTQYIFTYFFVYLQFITEPECSALVFHLTPNDKRFLLHLLPKDHKLSAGMQRIIDESNFELFEDRSKRHDDPLLPNFDGPPSRPTTPAAQPAVDDKALDMGTQLSELLMNSDLQKQWLFHFSANTTMNPLNVEQPQTTATTTIRTTRAPLVTKPKEVATTVKVQTTPNRNQSTIPPTKPTSAKSKQQRNNVVRQADFSGIGPLPGLQCGGVETTPAPQVTTCAQGMFTNADTIEISDTKAELINAKTETNDAMLEEKLQEILHGVEALEESAINAEGLPCPIAGQWVSQTAGASFCINPSQCNVLPVTIKAIAPGSFLNGTWALTLSFPIEDIPIFMLTAINVDDTKLAIFTGECRTCNKKDLIVGHWLLQKNAFTFEELNHAHYFFEDVWSKLN